VSTWLHTSTRARAIGAVYDVARPDAFFDVSPPAERFDALIFVESTTSTHATGAAPDR
jgi:erythromycin esterase-like protein